MNNIPFLYIHTSIACYVDSLSYIRTLKEYIAPAVLFRNRRHHQYSLATTIERASPSAVYKKKGSKQSANYAVVILATMRRIVVKS